MGMGDGVCRRSGTLECCREVALQAALSLPLSPAALDAQRLFEASGTQWRSSFGGPTGLDYAAVVPLAGALGLDFGELLPFLQVLEVDQLEAWAADRKRDEKKGGVKRG